MFRVTRSSGRRTRLDAAPRPSPISKLPYEIIREIFKFMVLSSEEARSHGVKTLCLVDRRWNDIANATSVLWTKITLTYPLNGDRLAVQKWLKTSGSKVMDVVVDLSYPTWYEPGKDNWVLPADFLRGVIAALRGSEHRWRSISVQSNTWDPIREFLQAWETPNLPALESISFTRLTASFISHIPQQSIEWPALFGGDGTIVPKLREVTLCGILVDWTLAATSFRNLRKLVILNNPREPGTTFGQFSELLAASPMLETLDIRGYHPNPDDSPARTRTPLVHLPALKHLSISWNRLDFACNFLLMLQIPETLETLCLAEAEFFSVNGRIFYVNDSSTIFNLLAILGSGSSKDKDFSRPWISMLGLKSLSVSWVYSGTYEVIQFLQKAPMIEKICLMDVSEGVLEAIAGAQLPGTLKSLDIRWRWKDGHTLAKPRRVVKRLRELRLPVTVRTFVGEHCSLIEVPEDM